MEEKVTSFFRFEDLRIYGKSLDYGRWVIVNLREAHNENESRFNKTFVKSAMSIAVNIAEGSSRSKAQFDHYLKNAKTAIRECVVYTTLAKNLGMFNEGQYEHSRELLMEQTRMIGALIISLQRGTRRIEGDDEPVSDDTIANVEFEAETNFDF
ncbi:MAG: four helix bundle protein [Bacteroidales bacterium]|jgi:four helix bundle protein|nr:four helix bundle protein [Bacteroidales bacterium]